MPRGVYRQLDVETGAALGDERFDCAPGPAGWRYVGHRDIGPPVTVDVTLDTAGRQVRVRFSAGGWQLRGGVAGPTVAWLRATEAGQQAAERSEHAAGFTTDSPAFLVATARLLRRGHRLGVGESRVLRLVEISAPAVSTRVLEQKWTFAGRTDHPSSAGPLPVERWDVDDLATGVRRTGYLAGDVVVAATGIELLQIDAPPSWLDEQTDPPDSQPGQPDPPASMADR